MLCPCDPRFLSADGFVPGSAVHVVFEIVQAFSPARYALVVTGTQFVNTLTLMSVPAVDMANGGYDPPGCNMVVKRLTSIAWPTTDPGTFTEGSHFGPVAWSSSMLGFNGGNLSSWTAGGGTQCRPDDSAKIIVTNFSLTGENDTINLENVNGGPCPT
jgi:hypothetical protein